MENVKTAGIVLRRYNYSENSLLVHFFTEQLGKIKTLVKGAKKAKGRFCGKLELSFIVELMIRHQDRSDLHLLTDISLKNSLEGLRLDVAKFAHAMVILELVDNAFEVESPHPTFYQDLARGLETLAIRPMDLWIPELILLKMLNALGLLPAEERCQECDKPLDGVFYFSFQKGASLCPKCLPKQSNSVVGNAWQVPYLKAVMGKSFLDCEKLPISETQKRQFFGWIRNILDGVVHKRIRSYSFLSQVGFEQ